MDSTVQNMQQGITNTHIEALKKAPAIENYLNRLIDTLYRTEGDIEGNEAFESIKNKSKNKRFPLGLRGIKEFFKYAVTPNFRESNDIASKFIDKYLTLLDKTIVKRNTLHHGDYDQITEKELNQYIRDGNQLLCNYHAFAYYIILNRYYIFVDKKLYIQVNDNTFIYKNTNIVKAINKEKELLKICRLDKERESLIITELLPILCYEKQELSIPLPYISKLIVKFCFFL